MAMFFNRGGDSDEVYGPTSVPEPRRCYKIAYATQREAKRAWTRICQRGGARSPRHLEPYQCRYCRLWHLGNNYR